MIFSAGNNADFYKTTQELKDFIFKPNKIFAKIWFLTQRCSFRIAEYYCLSKIMI